MDMYEIDPVHCIKTAINSLKVAQMFNESKISKESMVQLGKMIEQLSDILSEAEFVDE